MGKGEPDSDYNLYLFRELQFPVQFIRTLLPSTIQVAEVIFKIPITKANNEHVVARLLHETQSKFQF